jgi:glucose-1-phosphate cytidylyltransferase
MKVVLFCGGQGLRIRDYSENIPKPLIPIGSRPILWHVMRYYAHFGHKDFILCLGYKGETIKQFFLNYNECMSNDFVLSQGGKKLELLNSDIHDWNITFADTGIDSNIGQRLKSVEKYLDGERLFLANYTDGLTDLHLPTLIERAKDTGCIATFLSAPPNLSYHMVYSNAHGMVTDIREMTKSNLRINSGYFTFRSEIFDYISNGDDLVAESFPRLIGDQQLLAYEHDGFFLAMDTFKDRQQMEDLLARGNPPWEIWKKTPPHSTPVKSVVEKSMISTQQGPTRRSAHA